LPLSKIYR
jgi:Uncharacterized conserved protein